MPAAFDEPNLYAPPAAPPGPSLVGPVASADFFALFVRWEKFRLIYNGLLILETLVLLAGVGLRIPSPALVGSILIPGAILANVCFCAGFVANGYFWWIGWRSRTIGILIFLLGLVLSFLLVPIVLMGPRILG